METHKAQQIQQKLWDLRQDRITNMELALKVLAYALNHYAHKEQSGGVARAYLAKANKILEGVMELPSIIIPTKKNPSQKKGVLISNPETGEPYAKTDSIREAVWLTKVSHGTILHIANKRPIKRMRKDKTAYFAPVRQSKGYTFSFITEGDTNET